MTPDESDEVKKAKQIRDQAVREAADARGRWPEIWPVYDEAEYIRRKNHFSPLFVAAFEKARRSK